MTTTEFDEWFKYHCAAFEGLRAWMDKKVQEDADALRLWGKSLRRVSLRVAKQATEAMLADEKLQPEGYSRHPAKIVTFAKAHKGIEGEQPPARRVVGGEVAFVCAKCCDTGHVAVFSPAAMVAMRDGQFTWKHAHDVAAAACNCGWGRHLADTQNLVLLDERRMVLSRGGHDKEAVVALAAFFGLEAPAIVRPVHTRPGGRCVAQNAVPTAGDLVRLSEVVQELHEGRPPPDESEAFTPEPDEGPWHPGMDIAF